MNLEDVTESLSETSDSRKLLETESNISGGKEEHDLATSKACGKCGRKARKGCTQSVCLKCCTDESCDVHRDQRENALFREKILSGTTDVQLQAREKRSMFLTKGRFREPGFTYMGDTVVIWNVREYLDNPKWKEHALRKSAKRRARDDEETKGQTHTKTLSRKRFRQMMDDLYKKRLEETASS